jgi:hypothetical protein
MQGVPLMGEGDENTSGPASNSRLVHLHLGDVERKRMR